MAESQRNMLLRGNLELKKTNLENEIISMKRVARSSHNDTDPEIHLRILEQKSKTLEQVNLAISRLDHNNYGYCSDCENEISEPRLEALPFARRCKRCEETHERTRTTRRISSAPQPGDIYSGLDRYWPSTQQL